MSSRYTIPQLKELGNSPLVQKPPNLPSIDQWLQDKEKDARQKQLRHGIKPDENNNPLKRPLFAQRTKSHLTSARDESFLGPKISFASASAARQSGKQTESDDPIEDSLHKHSRSITRSDDPEARPRFMRTKDTDQEDDRNAKYKAKKERDSRDRFWRDKFDNVLSPTITDSKSTEPDEISRREKERKMDKEWSRGGQVQEKERDASHHWNMGSDPNDAHTQDDFKKWKEQMKAAEAGENQKDPTPAASTDQDTFGTQSLEPSSAIDSSIDSSFFASLPGLGPQEKTPDGNAAATKSSKPKSSRFASIFSAPPQQETPHIPESTPAPPVDQTSRADQEGFERMMAMLRMGNKSQEQQFSLFSSPAPTRPLPDSQVSPSPPSRVGREGTHASPNHNSASPSDSRPRQSISSMKVPSEISHQQIPPTSGQQNAAAPNKEAEFLMHLMKQQQPRTPFAEGQIYGQGYHRKEASDAMRPPSFPHTSHQQTQSHPQQQQQLPTMTQSQQPQSRGPPPGFMDNERAFHQNMVAVDQQPRGNIRQKSPDRTGITAQHQQILMAEQYERRQRLEDLQKAQQQKAQAQPRFDQGMPQFPNQTHGRPQSQSQNNIGPPPGFQMPRGPVPQGFFQLPPNGPPMQQMPPHQQIRPPGPPQHQMPPGYAQGHGPGPAFYNPPPGYLPHQQMLGGGPGPARRPPSGQMQPGQGFDVFGDGLRREQMMAQQGHFPH